MLRVTIFQERSWRDECVSYNIQSGKYRYQRQSGHALNPHCPSSKRESEKDFDVLSVEGLLAIMSSLK